MRIIACFLCLFLTVTCCEIRSGKGVLTVAKYTDSIVASTIDTIYSKNDTLIEAHRTIDDSGFIFNWSVKNSFTNFSTDTLPYGGFAYENVIKHDDIFYLKDGCGTGCSYLYVAEFKKGDRGSLFLSPLLIDVDRQIVIYQGNNLENLLSIRSIKSGRVTEIIEQFNRNRRPYNLGVDTLYFEKNFLHIKWEVQSDSFSTLKIHLSQLE